MDAKLTGELIARKRKELGLSQAELAERVHVTDKAISRWETGRGMPGVDSLEPLADALGLTVSELLSGRELTAEELPKAAQVQIVDSLRKNARMLWKGVLLAVLTLVILAALTTGLYIGYHYFTTVKADDLMGMTRAAGEYIAPPGTEGLEIVELEQRGDYIAALLTDANGRYYMCVYDRDKVFPERWRANGGKPKLNSGKVTSWNFGDPQGNTVIVVCGYNLPANAAGYILQNNGTVHLRPVDGQVLDLFVIPDGRPDINGIPVLVDKNLNAAEGGWQSWVDDMLVFN